MEDMGRKAKERLNAQRARGLANRDEAIATLYDVMDLLLTPAEKTPAPAAKPSDPPTTPVKTTA